MIVPPRSGTRLLADLRLVPRLHNRLDSPEDAADLAISAGRWGTAHLPGNLLARTWWTTVIRQYDSQLFGLLCGNPWSQVESRFKEEPNNATFEAVRDRVIVGAADRHTAADSILASHRWLNEQHVAVRVAALAELTVDARERALAPWARIEECFGGETHMWVSELALRSASSIENLAVWAGPNLRDGFNVLLNWRLISRTARCLVLAGLIDKSEIVFPATYPGWQWDHD